MQSITVENYFENCVCYISYMNFIDLKNKEYRKLNCHNISVIFSYENKGGK